ncbi:MAG: hypothetical protein JXR53_08370 [Bacteroidales bacterium]|nr:hypothetical protein [Bacteroidales bacterium]
MRLILVLITILLFTSCNNGDKKNNGIKAERTHLKKIRQAKLNKAIYLLINAVNEYELEGYQTCENKTVDYFYKGGDAWIGQRIQLGGTSNQTSLHATPAQIQNFESIKVKIDTLYFISIYIGKEEVLNQKIDVDSDALNSEQDEVLFLMDTVDNVIANKLSFNVFSGTVIRIRYWKSSGAIALEITSINPSIDSSIKYSFRREHVY